MSTNNIVSSQWRKRPADERFLSITALRDHFAGIRERSASKVVPSKVLAFAPDPENPRDGLVVSGQNGNSAAMTHWAFGQVANLAAAPGGYLRALPAPIAADCLNYGIRFGREVEDVGLLLERRPDSGITLRAATGPRYGRIWNAELAGALADRFGDGVTGQWKVPGEFGQDVPVTRENTTIYGGDRDIFVFLADERNRIEIPGRRGGRTGSLARGFYVWNSEVGAATVGAAFFLFDYVCCNRIIWGQEQFREVAIRHTASAPLRWVDEVAPLLEHYSAASAQPVEDMIAAARARRLDDVDAFLAGRFGAKQVATIRAVHEAEEGRPIETAWDAATAATAWARGFEHQDRRVEVERAAGAMLRAVQ